MIKQITLRQFRNYEELDLSVTAPVNVLIGNNGQGKSNLLEAIFFLSMLRSFRTSQVRELKKIGSGGFYIGMEADSGRGWSEKLEVEYGDLRKLQIDGVNVNRSSEFIRRLRTVVFSPEDIQIVTDNSSYRRRFIDMFVSLLEPVYMLSLQQYLTALKARNIALRCHHPDEAMVKAYEPIMAENAAVIIHYRSLYLRQLEAEIGKLLSEFHGLNKIFNIRYRADIDGTVEDLQKILDSGRRRDLERGFTGCGPQLDEIDLMFDGKLLRSFGSTGQCRLISLCLKMAEVNLLSETMKEEKNKLIVLVDDVTGELDDPTRRCFFDVINRAGQSFFTFTSHPSDIYFEKASFFEVNNGKITVKE